MARHGRVVMPAEPTILHVRQPALPQFRFEYHPAARTVYLVRLGVTPLHGDPIANDIDSHAGAINAVLIFSRGYMEARRSSALKRETQLSCP